MADKYDRQHVGTMDVERFRTVAHRAVDMAADYLLSIRGRPVFTPMKPSERERLLLRRLPESSLTPESILEVFREEILAHPMGNGHPRFFGWVNSPPAPIGIVAELLGAVMNPSCAGGDHAAIYLERAVVRWIAELVGFPLEPSGLGLLVSGGSMASLTCLAAARHHSATSDGWNEREDGIQKSERPPLVLYLSEEGHGCMRKAAELLGIGSKWVRLVQTNSRFEMDLSALSKAVQKDRELGYRPFCVAASAGTVNSGAVDPLQELANFCNEQKLWFHVDGAYGAFGILDDAAAHLYQGLAEADSLALDPHKWLSVPVECGCALVRNGQALRDTFSLVPPYLRTEEGKGFGGLPWFSEYGFQQTRGFRALKLWMVIEHTGRGGLQALVKRNNALARRLSELIEAEPDLEVLAPTVLSVVCFRYAPAKFQGDDDALNRLNKKLMETLQAGGEVFLSGTTLRNRFALRACALHYDTNEADLSALIGAVRNVGNTMLANVDHE
jgi:aromatic-L-amino-acid decarboxylase